MKWNLFKINFIWFKIELNYLRLKKKNILAKSSSAVQNMVTCGTRNKSCTETYRLLKPTNLAPVLWATAHAKERHILLPLSVCLQVAWWVLSKSVCLDQNCDPGACELFNAVPLWVYEFIAPISCLDASHFQQVMTK